ncbi:MULTISPECIES: hypothetical protein [unclassified Janthinobacterium]|uniref:hypothetical protein n=1 Tax=unclassified Janthinobacterium TaxID=2610881 RepID=UPI001609D227|nr:MULTISPECIES: hypothetical protein [unclassified Janthinobacterium]MBB5610537.1 hypothetical protein [Janthinobacterium sp. S3T4]MBB5616009.1 hypothetical protein [Janthinobacterium sp. S3M3]
MAITEESNKKAAADYAAAYAEEPQRVEQTEDEAFGLTPDEAPGTATPTGTAPTVSIDLDKSRDGGEGEPAPAAAGKEAAGPASDDPAAQEAGAAQALDVEKENQRLRSWEGRLKAQQAELDREKAGAGTPAAGDKGDQDDKGDAAGKGDEEGVDSDDPDLKALADDFGPEFVALLLKVINKVAKRCATTVAGEHAGPVRQDIDAIIAEITSEKERAHFEKIADAHPDFMDIANSDEFKAWLAGLAPAEKEETERVASAGTAKEIIAMLKKYKASKSDGDADMDTAMDQAEGVRSTGGLKLPESPTAAKDYETAWEAH